MELVADWDLEKVFIDHITDPELMAIMRIQSVCLQEMQNFMLSNGFIQLMPVLISPITDPLNHSVYPADLMYENRRFKLTASMIFHKQLSLIPEKIEKIFIVAPNIRLEKDTIKASENHLIEFSQLDMEFKGCSMKVVMDFITSFYVYLFEAVRVRCEDELSLLHRKLPELKRPFPVYSTEGVPPEEVDDFCEKISRESTIPSFITNFKREFYDRENPDKPKVYCNFDMVYPEGYGEALSGAEREFEYEQIVNRMKELDMDMAPYGNYLRLAQKGLIPPSAGAGIGIQRLLRYICGKETIASVCMFDRSIASNFLF